MRVLLATNNAEKRAELEHLLAPLGVEVVHPAAVGGLPEVEEDGETLAENAAKKARSAAAAHGLWALADDSGLEVDHLRGAPGVRSARYAGEGASDADNNGRLLAELAGVPQGRRGARFVCTLALARPDGTVAALIDGTARGRILEGPLGTSGFGYDPLFLFDEPGSPASGRTFAQLSRAEKARVSHRGRALRRLAEALPELLSESTDTALPGPA